MTVYIEYVIIDNLIIDFLILKATFSLTKLDYGKRRLFICAFLGAIIALIYPLLQINQVILTLVKILSGLLILLLANDYKRKKTFYVNAIVFFSLVFLTGGAVTGIYNIFNIPLSTEISVALVFLHVYLIIKGLGEVITFFYKKKEIISFLYKVELKVFNNSVLSTGFLDTGNGVYYNNEPVIFASHNFAKKVLGDNLIKAKFNKILITTATGENENLSFTIDELILYKGDKEHIFKNIRVCIAKIKNSDYDIILHPVLIKEGYESQDTKTSKKVC